MDEAEVRQLILDKIASGEAKNYTTIYGGHQFGSLDQHPNIRVPITSGPNAGKYSTAAGRYQFLYDTWNEQARRLGLKDFSPASQDAAAYDLAQRVYRTQTGRSLIADTQAGNTDWSALGGTWESLLHAKSGPGGGAAAGPNFSGGPMAGGAVPNPTLGTEGIDPRQAAVKELLGQILAKKQPEVGPKMIYDPSKYAGVNALGGNLG